MGKSHILFGDLDCITAVMMTHKKKNHKTHRCAYCVKSITFFNISTLSFMRSIQKNSNQKLKNNFRIYLRFFHLMNNSHTHPIAISGNAKAVIENFPNHNSAIIIEENVVQMFDQIITHTALGRAMIHAQTNTKRSRETRLLLCVTAVAHIPKRKEFRLFFVYFSSFSWSDDLTSFLITSSIRTIP